jgi:histone-lysine N-methyltransferase SETMAR
MPQEGVLFLHNSPAHWALSTQKKLAYMSFQCLDHTPYSSDMALSNYHLFPGKKQLKGPIFLSNMGVIAAAETWFDRQPTEFFGGGFQKLEQRANYCIALCGEHVEYIPVWLL